jgi:hypothetical protein
MPSLEKRIAELEKGASMDEGPKTIIIRCMTPGNTAQEIQELHDATGCERWMRQPGETELAFIDRASREATRNGVACALLMDGE